MTEPLVRDYLLGKISAEQLEKSTEKISPKMLPYYQAVEMITDGEFRITNLHLISICDDVLRHRLKPDTLEPLTFILIGSDYFYWDTNSKEGQLVEEVIFEWNSPILNYPLTLENMIEWRNYLEGRARNMKDH